MPFTPIEGTGFEPIRKDGFTKIKDSFTSKVVDIPAQAGAGVLAAVGNVANLVSDISGMRDPLSGIAEEEKTPSDLAFQFSRNAGIELQPDPKSIVGAFTKGISQFLTGFVPASRAFKSIGVASNLKNALASGAISDFSVFDPHEERLSNLIQSVPMLQNPVTEFLQAKEDDPKILGRVKQVLEGVGLGALTDMTIRGIRLVKSANKVKSEVTGIPVTPEEILKPATETKVAGTDIDNILDKFDTVDDIKNVFNNSVKSIESDVTRARRGTISWKETEETARFLAEDPKTLLARKGSEALNAEQLEAMKLTLKKSSEEVHSAAKKALSGSSEDLLRFEQYMNRYYAVIKEFMGARAEAGRALNILRKSFAKTDDLNSVIKSLGGQDSLLEKASIIARAETPDQIAVGIKTLQKPRLSDAGMEAWINMLLSGPQTHAVNMLSNSLTTVWRIQENLLAAVIGKFHRGEKVFLREITPRIFGVFQGAKSGMRAATKTFLTETPSDIFSKIEAPRQRAMIAETFGTTEKTFPGKIINATGKIVRIPGRALMAEDEFFKSINYRAEINGLAMRDGISKGLKGENLSQHIQKIISSPSDEISKAALNAARYATFTKPLGRSGVSIQQFAQSHPAARVLMPFIRTPVNIIKFSGERTPFAVFSKTVREEIRKGGISRDMAIAKMASGTAIMAGTMAYAAEGRITGGGPSDTDARAALFRTGWQPYSILIGDTYHAYGRLEPLGILLGVSSDFADISGEIGEEDARNIASMLIASASKNITSKTWLRGLSSAIEAMEDPDRYAEQFVSGLAGTVVPTGVAQVARIQDPILRDARTVLDRIKSRIPGYSKDLPPRKNLWGEPITLQGGLGPDIVSPIYTNRKEMDKVNSEIVRLEMKPSKPDRKLHGSELTPKQYSEYVSLAGAPAKRLLDKIVNSSSWESIPDFKKVDIIEDVIKDRRRDAVKLMTAKYPELRIEKEFRKIKKVNKSI